MATSAVKSKASVANTDTNLLDRMGHGPARPRARKQGAAAPAPHRLTPQAVRSAVAGAQRQVNTFAAQYQQAAAGKSGTQKLMDGVRRNFNQGYADDQFKNIGHTQVRLDRLRQQLERGAISPALAKDQLAQIERGFNAEAQRVATAQAGNAHKGQVVQGAGRFGVVTLGTLGAGALAIESGPGAIAAAAAGGTLAGSAYDAAFVLEQGRGPIAPKLNNNQSLGGLVTRAVKGEKISGGDVVWGVTGTAIDAASGGLMRAGVASATVAQAGVRQAAARGGKQASRLALGHAAGKAYAGNGLLQSGSTLTLQSTGTAFNPDLSPAQKHQALGNYALSSVRNLPGQLAGGYLGAHLGVSARLGNQVADTGTQLFVAGSTGLGQASALNALSGRGAAVTEDDLIATLVGAGPLSLLNRAPRLPPQGAVAARQLLSGADRPLPARVQVAAAQLAIPRKTADAVVKAYGGPFSGEAMVKYLRLISPPALTQADATRFVQTVRSTQNESTRTVKALIAQAMDQRDASGAAAPMFTEAMWANIRTALQAQPRLDNDAARALLRAAGDPALHEDRGYNLSAMHEAKAYLHDIGYDQLSLRWLPSHGLAVNHPYASYTKTDDTFARLVAQTGLAQTPPGPGLGVSDNFSPLIHDSARVNTTWLGRGAQHNEVRPHGHMVASVAGQGLGQWGALRLAHTNVVPDIEQAVRQLVASGTRTINFSFSPKVVSFATRIGSIMSENPNVKFVVAAGNGIDGIGKDVAALPRFHSVGSGLDNVTYVGSVDLHGELSPFSHSAPFAVYAYGEERPLASVVRQEGGLVGTSANESGTSFAAPDVANTYHKMDFLCPELTPAQSKAIVTATAIDVPQQATAAQRAARVPVVQNDDALAVAALEGLLRRQLRPVTQSVSLQAPLSGEIQSRRLWAAAPPQNPLTLNQAADILRLRPQERARLLPIAERLFPR